MLEITADNLPVIMGCQGSRLMDASPSISSNNGTSSKEEGIAAHYMAQAVFSGMVSDASELVDRRAPNGVYMSADMAEHVTEYLAIFSNHASMCTFAEMESDTILEGPEFRIVGRGDWIAFSPFGTLNILDLKYGHRLVEPEKNWTLLFHAIAWCVKHGIQPSQIVMEIFQPRAYHHAGRLRQWVINYEELRTYENHLRWTLANISDTLQTGPHCVTCPANATCPAARKADLNAVEASEIAFNDEISNDDLSYHLDLIDRAEAHLKASKKSLIELARFRLNGGQIINNYALDIQYGNTAWLDFVTPELLQSVTGKDLTKPGLMTPGQAIKKGVPEDAIKAFTHRPTKGVNLVRENAAKRAARLFGK